MRRVLVASAMVLVCVACGKDGVNPVGPNDGNYAPVIQSVQVDPATVAPGGTATVRVAATDKDGDQLTVTYKADRGTVTPDAGSPFVATYRAGTADDVLHVTVADKYVSRSQDAVVRVVSGSEPTPEPTTTPTTTPEPTPTPGPAAPTVTLTAVGPTTCHPTKKADGTVTPCAVAFTASGSNYSSLAWSGCCAGSTGTTGNCSPVNALESFTCTVTATGAGGTAVVGANATGTNSAPVVEGSIRYCCGNGSGCLTTFPPNTDSIQCGVFATDADSDALACSFQTSGGACRPVTCGPSTMANVYWIVLKTDGVGTCNLAWSLNDRWVEVHGPGASYSVE